MTVILLEQLQLRKFPVVYNATVHITLSYILSTPLPRPCHAPQEQLPEKGAEALQLTLLFDEKAVLQRSASYLVRSLGVRKREGRGGVGAE